MSDERDRRDDPVQNQPAGDASPPPPVVHRSDELLQGRKEAWIEHEGVMYRLRLTSAGKLYLTK